MTSSTEGEGLSVLCILAVEASSAALDIELCLWRVCAFSVIVLTTVASAVAFVEVPSVTAAVAASLMDTWSTGSANGVSVPAPASCEQSKQRKRLKCTKGLENRLSKGCHHTGSTDRDTCKLHPRFGGSGHMIVQTRGRYLNISPVPDAGRAR